LLRPPRPVRRILRRDRDGRGAFTGGQQEARQSRPDRVRGAATLGKVDLARRCAVVEAFLAASRGGDLNALLELLAPDVVRRADRVAVPAEVRGARVVADETRLFARLARSAEVALVDGTPGAVGPDRTASSLLRDGLV
jgi:hypothetical protein